MNLNSLFFCYGKIFGMSESLTGDLSHHEPGAPPGSLIHVGDPEVKSREITVELIDYNEQEITHEKTVQEPTSLKPFRDRDSITWINVNGVHDPELIGAVGENFDLHSLIQEDIMHTGQRAKVEAYGDILYIILRMFQIHENSVDSEQVSLILGDNYVLSFQESEGDVFNPIRDRLSSNKGRIRKSGADYLVYTLMDAIVDNYFVVLETVGEQIEHVQEDLIEHPQPEKLEHIYNLKRDVSYLRKSVWPLREVVSSLQRGGYEQFSEETDLYLRDLYDHIIQVMDNIENFREIISSLIDIYMSSISNRMNEVMKVLTHHFYPPDLYRRCLRNEFRVYAGTHLALGVLRNPGVDGRGGTSDAVLFLPEGLAVITVDLGDFSPAPNTPVKREPCIPPYESERTGSYRLSGDDRRR